MLNTTNGRCVRDPTKTDGRDDNNNNNNNDSNDQQLVVYADPGFCNKYFKDPLDDHGRYCSECTDYGCVTYQDIECLAGQVYNGWEMKCKTCEEEFGNGTLACNNTGATLCSDSNYMVKAQVTENITNNICRTCDSELDNCQICQNATKCEQCKIRHMLDWQGQCRSCPNFCLACSKNETKCEICENGFYLDPRDNKCYIDIYTPTDQDVISKNYRLANAEPVDFVISDDGTTTLYTAAMGRIELKAGDQWGTICSHDANDAAAGIICKSVGLPTENAVLVKNYPVGAVDDLNIWFDDINCKGTERELKYCQKSTYISSIDDFCDHSQDLGAICR